MRIITKLFVLLSLIAIQGTSLFGQIPTIRYGAKAGVNISYATFDNDLADSNLRLGYQIGGTVDFEFSKVFLLQSGLTFIKKGSKIENFNTKVGIGGGNINNNDTYSFDQLYISIPLLAGYKINVADNLDVIFAAGPYYSYGIGGKTKINYDSSDLLENGVREVKYDTFDSDKGLKKSDLGLAINLSAEYTKVIVSLSYELGFTNLAQGDGAEYKNNCGMFSLGYKF